MLDFYIGQAGIPPDQFWRNTWKENALLGAPRSTFLTEQVR
jgi:hypothetical protein